jgi:hypothetical protein
MDNSEILYIGSLGDEVFYNKHGININNIGEYDLYAGVGFDVAEEFGRTEFFKYESPGHTYETINPIQGYSRKQENVLSYANFLFECDEDDISAQNKKAVNLAKNGVINRSVFSGSKSIHNRITVSDPPSNCEEYKFLWKLLNDSYFSDINTDKQCKDCTRLTRSPFVIRAGTGLEQKLLFLSTGRLSIDWRKKYENTLKAERLISKTRKTVADSKRFYMLNKADPDGRGNVVFSKDNKQYADFFESGRMDDNCKHEYLPKAVKYWLANKYPEDEVERILSYYKKSNRGKSDLYSWGMRMYKHG